MSRRRRGNRRNLPAIGPVIVINDLVSLELQYSVPLNRVNSSRLDMTRTEDRILMHVRIAAWLPLVTLACGGDPVEQPTYDSASLAEYRQAIPLEERLVSGVPAATSQPFALVAPVRTVLAGQAVGFARAVNGPARALVAVLREIVDQPPTSFDASRRAFMWGPWPSDTGVGQVSVVITKNEPGADFAYSYALERSSDADPDTRWSVIVGAATPDPDSSERGVGVALWDLALDSAFELEHDPSYVADSGRTGRVVMLFGHAAGSRAAAFNVALFRDFLPAAVDRSDAAMDPINVDYFYGHFEGDQGVVVDFVDSEVFADLCDAAPDSCFERDVVDDAPERFGFNAFFVNRGLGRAEARLSEGDLAQAVSMVECWSSDLRQSSFSVGVPGDMVETVSNGSCATPADQSATELGLPTLGDIDPALLEAMSCAAENGSIGCE